MVLRHHLATHRIVKQSAHQHRRRGEDIEIAVGPAPASSANGAGRTAPNGVLLEMRDHGRGIYADQVGRVFEELLERTGVAAVEAPA